jgi:hypothetical protein
VSQPQIKIPRELRLDIEALAAEAGASVTFEPTGSSHWRATITRNGSSRFIVISCTPKDAHSFSRAVLGDARRELRNLGYVKPKEASEWGMQRSTLKGRRSLSRPLASPRERLDHRKRLRTDPDIYLNAMGAALEGGTALSVLCSSNGEDQSCGRNHARASDAGAAGR